ncbi:MAG TPA: hypothetical protein VFA86_14290 [Gammaproteobacteria bacterium]|nr:hypothetical protein [Gammaproteobacteria bacterium]
MALTPTWAMPALPPAPEAPFPCFLFFFFPFPVLAGVYVQPQSWWIVGSAELVAAGFWLKVRPMP